MIPRVFMDAGERRELFAHFDVFYLIFALIIGSVDEDDVVNIF